MKFCAAVVAAVLAVSSLTFAMPLQRRAGVGSVKSMPQAKSSDSTRLDAGGAVYFLTNEGDVNQILAATINADGTLNLDRSIDAGGRGSHGKADGPDALFSQGSIKASKAGKVLAAVNAGSNTVALFSIDPNQPTNLTPIGDVVSSEGEFPISLAFNKDGSRFCVLNGGRVNGVNCYKVDRKLGPVAVDNSLRLLTDQLKVSTPPAGPANTASHVLFSEDGKKLIASVKGTPQKPGFYAVWDVNSADGSLSANFNKVSPGKGGALPFGMAVIPGKNAVLATDAGIGFDILNLQNTNTNTANKIGGQVATCWAAFSPATKNFYLTDIGTALVSEVAIDDNLKGRLVIQHPLTPGSAPIDLDIATIKGRDFVYILAANGKTVDVLAIDSPGLATKLTALDITGPTNAAGVTINSNNLQGLTTFVA